MPDRIELALPHVGFVRGFVPLCDGGECGIVAVSVRARVVRIYCAFTATVAGNDGSRLLPFVSVWRQCRRKFATATRPNQSHLWHRSHTCARLFGRVQTMRQQYEPFAHFSASAAAGRCHSFIESAHHWSWCAIYRRMCAMRCL